MTITRAEAFELLQVPRDATEDQIKASYRKLALKYHPDKNKDDESAKTSFQRINAAYHLVTSEEEVNSISDEQIAHLFQQLIRSELFTYLSQKYSFSEDESEYYESDEDCHNVEQWQKIEQQAQENAQKLVDEVEQDKKKLEKKRERRKKHKQRRKEKKREEKEVTKKESKDKYEIKEVSSVHHIINNPNNESLQTDNHTKKVKSNYNKAQESESDSPEIDLGSAFCSNVKQKVDKSEARSRKASDKSNNASSDQNKRSSPNHDSKAVDNHVSQSNNINDNPVPQNQSHRPEPPSEENFFKSQEHARKGNEFAQFGKLHNAIEEYTKAINLNKIDHRCYGNRSYCYHSLKRYEEALSDANAAVSLVPNEPKGYFRKAKALCGLKRFNEAESALQKILELDPECSEASHELFEVRLLQLQDFGFDRRACEHALIKSKNDIQGAIEFLLSSQFKDNMSFSSNDTYEEPPPPPQIPHHQPIYNNIPQMRPPPMSTFYPIIQTNPYSAPPPMRLPAMPPGAQPHMIPAFQAAPFPRPLMGNMAMSNGNIMRAPMPPQKHGQQMSVRPNTMAVRPNNKHVNKNYQNHPININKPLANGNARIRKFDPRDYSLWIGHFDSKKINEKDLYDVFTKYGKVSGVVIIKTHGKPLAYSFIHFMKHEDAKRAFNAAQNHVIQGISLDVNWNKNPTIECEHWLRGHCPYSNCHYLHVVDHQIR